jgi:hypothetical protein
VSQAEIREAIWPDAEVGGTTIARLLCEVRAAVDDDARTPGVIRTVHRFGYAFSGPAELEAPDDGALPASPSAGCAVQWGARLIALAPGENVIGRASDAAVSISLDRVSRRHARILVEEGRALLEDLGSKHGTRLADRTIEGPVQLKHGDHITVGPVLLIFRDQASEESTF